MRLPHCLGLGLCVFFLVSASPPPGLQSHPSLAALPDTLLGLWVDSADPSGSRIHWGRFTQPLPDSLGTLLANGPGSETRGALAVSGNWGVAVWEAWNTGVPDILAGALTVQSPAPLSGTVLSTGSASAVRPAAAANDSVAFLVWEDERAEPGDVYAARWDRGVGLRDPLGIPLATGASDQRWPRVASGGAGFLAVWSEQVAGTYRVKVQAFDALGIPAATARFVSPAGTDATWPDVSVAAGGYMVAWAESGGALGWVSVSVLGDSVASAARYDPAGFAYGPRLAAGASGTVLAWTELTGAGRSHRRARLGAPGALLPAQGLALTPPEDHAADLALAASGDSVWAAWRIPLPDDEDDVFLAVFPAHDTVGVQTTFLMARTPDTPLAVPGPDHAGVLAHPNPFRSDVRFPLMAPDESVEIFDAQGRSVRVLAGVESRRWDGRTASGRPVPAGVYWARGRSSGWSVRLVRLP